MKPNESQLINRPLNRGNSMARRESPWGAPSAGDRHQIRQIAEASGQVISDMVQGHIEGEMFVREDPGAFAMVETERPDNLLADFESFRRGGVLDGSDTHE